MYLWVGCCRIPALSSKAALLNKPVRGPVAPGLDETGGERMDMSLTSISDYKMYLWVGCCRIPALSSKAALLNKPVRGPVAPGLDETGGKRMDMSLTSISDCKMYLWVGCCRIPALSSKAALLNKPVRGPVAPGLDETGGERMDMSLTSISDYKMYLWVGCCRIPALSSKAALLNKPVRGPVAPGLDETGGERMDMSLTSISDYKMYLWVGCCRIPALSSKAALLNKPVRGPVAPGLDETGGERK